MSQTFTTHFSTRGHPLVYTGPLPEPGRPSILTIENYCKWYELWLVTPSGVEKVAYDGTITWFDHVPSPAHVQEFAEQHGYEMDLEAIEFIAGRFVLEVEGREPEFLGSQTWRMDRMLLGALFRYIAEDPLHLTQFLASYDFRHPDLDESDVAEFRQAKAHAIAGRYKSLRGRFGIGDF